MSGEIPVLTTSVITGSGTEEVRAHLTKGRTVAMLGTSGSGKSSMVNALMGSAVVATGAVRESDARGRHTTTWRELLIAPSGGTLIDTPGLRELGMWITDEGIDSAFSDVIELEGECRFTNCGHVGEPGCAVLEAIATGALDARRLDNYRKLQKEAAFAAREERPPSGQGGTAGVEAAGGRGPSESPPLIGGRDGGVRHGGPNPGRWCVVEG